MKAGLHTPWSDEIDLISFAPAGTGEGNMPVGVQLMAPELGEARLLKIAAALETALGK